MRKVLFSESAINSLEMIKKINPKLILKVFELIIDIQKKPFAGLGKPEPLKGNFSGCWSRRIGCIPNCRNRFKAVVGGNTDHGRLPWLASLPARDNLECPRRITDEHCLIYKVNNDTNEIYSAYGITKINLKPN